MLGGISNVDTGKILCNIPGNGQNNANKVARLHEQLAKHQAPDSFLTLYHLFKQNLRMPFVISKDLDRPSHKDQCLLWLPPLKMYKVTQTTYRLKFTPLTVRLATNRLCSWMCQKFYAPPPCATFPGLCSSPKRKTKQITAL